MRTPVVPERQRTVNLINRDRRFAPMPPAQFGNLGLAVRVIGNLKRFADLQRRQFLGAFAPLGGSSQRFPRTVDYMLIADAERITAERIDSVALFAPHPSLSQKLKPRPSSKRGIRCLDAIFPLLSAWARCFALRDSILHNCVCSPGVPRQQSRLPLRTIEHKKEQHHREAAKRIDER